MFLYSYPNASNPTANDYILYGPAGVAYHAGQIIFVTKLRRGEDMGFTRLPGEKRKPTRLPPI